MSYDRRVAHLRRRPNNMAGITRRPGKDGSTVFSLTQTPTADEPISAADLRRELEAQKIARRNTRGNL